mmetsp:Transcript_65748/g.147746  ORF Transcript_65748/g.147746 Transcript_65748/m.147746 type:complete len:201 (-) Transcript_65748:229-831(-)
MRQRRRRRTVSSRRIQTTPRPRRSLESPPSWAALLPWTIPLAVPRRCESWCACMRRSWCEGGKKGGPSGKRSDRLPKRPLLLPLRPRAGLWASASFGVALTSCRGRSLLRGARPLRVRRRSLRHFRMHLAELPDLWRQCAGEVEGACAGFTSPPKGKSQSGRRLLVSWHWSRESMSAWLGDGRTRRESRRLATWPSGRSW